MSFLLLSQVNAGGLPMEDSPSWVFPGAVLFFVLIVFLISIIYIIILRRRLSEIRGEVDQLSRTDLLTGLLNRKSLNEALDREYYRSERYDHVFSLILLDIDDFKRINDDFGFTIGDEVLEVFSEILRDHVRTTDIVGRWDGEEFVIICSETSGDQAMKLAGNLRHIIDETEIPVVKKCTASFGIASIEKGENVGDVLKRTADALLIAKKEGKNRVVSG